MSEQPPHFLPMEARLKSTQLEPRTKSGSAYERAVADALLQEDHRPGRIEEEEAEIARKKQTDAPELLIARKKKADKLAERRAERERQNRQLEQEEAERRNLEYQTKSAEETRSALADARALINEEPEVKHAATSVHNALSDVHNLLSDETGISAVRGLQDRKRSDEEIEKAGDIPTLRTRHRRVEDAPTRISNDMAKDRDAREARIKAKDEELDTQDKESRAEQAAQKLKLRETFKRVNGLIQLFGRELLQQKYSLSIPMIEGLSEDEINKLDRRLKAIQKEENIEMDRLYQEAEADRTNRADRDRRQTSQVKTSTYEPKPQESIIVDDLDAMKNEEEVEAYVRDNFDAPLAESDKLIAQAEKQKEEDAFFEEQAKRQQAERKIAREISAREKKGAEPVNLADLPELQPEPVELARPPYQVSRRELRRNLHNPLDLSPNFVKPESDLQEEGNDRIKKPVIDATRRDPSSVYRLAGAELQEHPERVHALSEEVERRQAWALQIPRMNRAELINAATRFGIDLRDQTPLGLHNATRLINSGTERGKIFSMLFDRFVHVNTEQKRGENEKQERVRIAREQIESASVQMRDLLEKTRSILTLAQQQEIQQILLQKVQAERVGDVPKALDLIETATNTLKRFERLYEELQRTGALKTSTPPTIKPPGLLSRIGSFLGFGRK
jgi:hypothetical protein